MTTSLTPNEKEIAFRLWQFAMVENNRDQELWTSAPETVREAVFAAMKAAHSLSVEARRDVLSQNPFA